jgi:hypothetical protein
MTASDRGNRLPTLLANNAVLLARRCCGVIRCARATGSVPAPLDLVRRALWLSAMRGPKL